MAETSRRRRLQIAFNKANNITPTPLVKKITRNSILDLVSPKNHSSKSVELQVAIALEEVERPFQQVHLLGDKGKDHDKGDQIHYSGGTTEESYFKPTPLSSVANGSDASLPYQLKSHDPLLGSVRRELGKDQLQKATRKERPLTRGRRGARARGRAGGRGGTPHVERQPDENNTYDDVARQSERETVVDSQAPVAIIASMADQLLKEFETL
jgi:hypothetical protein